MRALLLLAAVVEIALLLAIPAPPNPDKPGRSGGVRTAAAQLRGTGPPVDLVQDFVGARALVLNREPYPVLTEAFARVGISWPAPHRSTHPPTAFLLVLPVAWLPFKAAAAVWAALMLAAMGGSWWAFGLRWEAAAALAPLTVLWPPAAWSLGQLTPIWLLGLAVAWRLRDRPAAAGAAIALASLTKLFPAVSLVPFLLRRQWSVLRGFALVWGAALAVLALLAPSAITRYVTIGRTVSREQASRGENAALFVAAWHRLGPVGVAGAVALAAAVVAVSVRRLRAAGTLDRPSWDAWSWVGVALLPIAWIYSLLPLLPGLVRSALRGGPIAAALAVFAFVVPFTIDPFGLPGATWLAAATACSGLALVAGPAWPAVARRLRPRAADTRPPEPA